ncbi:MAG: hypothetical protein JWR40_3984 [Massilia sp.]|jgi:hypothetical protein|nr:hypothetical protein [Massilia sp.]MDB5951929.1 hypothetical protein [Massilia sp.]
MTIKRGALLAFSILLQSATSALASECSFRPPQALLQSDAYWHHAFRSDTGNRAVESAELRDGLRIEISRSQCVDFLVREISLIVPARTVGQGDKAWLSFAQAEIGRLKRRNPEDDFSELQRFLIEARHIPPRNGTRSACKDHSSAPAGDCAWQSMGGFIFKVSKSKGKLRISATEYVSG